MNDVSAAPVVDESAAPASVWPLKIPLKKAIRDKDANQVKEISFREPTAADIIACGNPADIRFLADGTNWARTNDKKMAAMVALLAEIAPPFVKQMGAQDWLRVSAQLREFFLPDLNEQSDVWPRKIPLRKRISGGDDVTRGELSLREPCAGDIMECGNPVDLGVAADGAMVPEFHPMMMTAMIARLGDVPYDKATAMDTRDWNNCAWALLGFFLPEAATA